MPKHNKLYWWLLVGAVLVGTNNVVQFIENVKTGDPVFYGALVVIGLLSIRNVDVGGVFK